MENLIFFFLNVQQSIQKVWFEFKNQKRIKEERSEGNGDGEEDGENYEEEIVEEGSAQ